MTHEELNESIDRAEGWFSQVPHVIPEMVEAFIEEGFLSYDDLVLSLEPAQLAELSGMTEGQAEEAIAFAEEAAQRVEEEQRAAKAAAAAEADHVSTAVLVGHGASFEALATVEVGSCIGGRQPYRQAEGRN